MTVKEDMQLDLHGNEIPLSKIQREKGKQPTYKSQFRGLYGVRTDHQCKECRFAVQVRYSKTYYKCEKLGFTSSPATDIRLKDFACNLFEPIGETE